MGWICPAGVLLQLGRKELDKPGLGFVFVFIFVFLVRPKLPAYLCRYVLKKQVSGNFVKGKN